MIDNKIANIMLGSKDTKNEGQNSESVPVDALLKNEVGNFCVCEFVDNTLKFDFFSKQLESIIGYSDQELTNIITEKQVGIWVGDDFFTLRKKVFEQLNSQSTFALEYRVKKKNGDIAWILSQGQLLQKDESCVQLQCISTDITQQKEEELLLAQKQLDLETIVNNIDVAIIRCNFDAKVTITYANNGFYRMIKYSKTEFEHKYENSLSKIIYREDLQQFNDSVKKLKDVESLEDNAFRLIKKDGSLLWILAKGVTYIKGDGTREIHGVFTDMSKQKEQEEILRISDMRYAIAMNYTDATIFDYDILTKKMYFNNADILTYNLPKVLDNAVETMIESGFVMPQSHNEYRQMYHDIENGAPFVHGVINISDKMNNENIFDLSISTIFDENNRPIKAIGVKKDITQTILLKKELEFSNTLASNRYMTFEVNISKNKVVSINQEWINESNIVSSPNFSVLVQNICDSLILHSHINNFKIALSANNISTIYEQGKRLFTFEYQKKMDNDVYHWFEMTVNIIKNELSGDINIRCYIDDIDKFKQKKLLSFKEKHFYNALSIKTTLAYEINFSKNLFISGHERWETDFKMHCNNIYSDMIKGFMDKAVHPDDKEIFKANFSRNKIMQDYYLDKNEEICEFRRLDGEDFIWIKCQLHLYKEHESGDIKGFCYVENINDEKNKELAILYKSEHDMLTGFLNKTTTVEKIKSILESDKNKTGKYAFFMLDFDNFKAVNDNFGHSFGDDVLSKTSIKIKELFSDLDICGRIGGDEFAILMNNVKSEELAIKKAQDILRVVVESYTQNGVTYTVNISIGIAFYGINGTTYKELYQHADTALYFSKQHGRGQFTIYKDDMN